MTKQSLPPARVHPNRQSSQEAEAFHQISAASTSCFFRFPGEIRTQIYKCCFDNAGLGGLVRTYPDGFMSVQGGKLRPFFQKASSILQLNHVIRKEAKSLLFSTCLSHILNENRGYVHGLLELGLMLEYLPENKWYCINGWVTTRNEDRILLNLIKKSGPRPIYKFIASADNISMKALLSEFSEPHEVRHTDDDRYPFLYHWSYDTKHEVNMIITCVHDKVGSKLVDIELHGQLGLLPGIQQFVRQLYADEPNSNPL